MTLRSVIWKELRQRPTSVMTCLLAISLGVAALVAIRSVTVASENAVAGQLEALGANVLLLPQSSTLQDYYSADMNGQTLPEEHAMRLALANLEGVERISPKLCVAAEMNGRKLTLTGILPQSEFQAAAAWQGVSMFSNKHAGCKRAVCQPVSGSPSESLAKQRHIQNLDPDEAYLGIDVAQAAKLGRGDRISLLGHTFNIAGVLPATGTVDDSRVFAHLHTVQRAAGAGETVNAIELMACCENAAGSLSPKLSGMFPDAKVVTIAHVVETQVSVNRLMARLSYAFFGILLVVSMVSVAGTMFANVSERRREIGTLMALGATQSWVSRLFLGKALVIGATGGILGFVMGTIVAAIVGPVLVRVSVPPMPVLGAISILLAGAAALVASYWPACRAARIDPCLCFREV